MVVTEYLRAPHSDGRANTTAGAVAWELVDETLDEMQVEEMQVEEMQVDQGEGSEQIKSARQRKPTDRLDVRAGAGQHYGSLPATGSPSGAAPVSRTPPSGAGGSMDANSPAAPQLIPATGSPSGAAPVSGTPPSGGSGGSTSGKGNRGGNRGGKGRSSGGSNRQSARGKAAVGSHTRCSTTPPPLEEQLAKIIGMEPLKEQLRSFHQCCVDAIAVRAAGHPTLETPYHMLLLGNPGTGKTTVARLLYDMLKSAGVLAPDAPFIEFKASHAEGSNLGEARENVQREIERARGGVLFADEAHNLAAHKDNIYGQQAASQLMDCLQDGDDNDAARRVIVIYAGYPEPMKKLLNSDPGYKRRVKHNFTLPDYTPFELAQIFLKKAEDLGRGIGDDVTAEEIGKLINKHTTAQYRSDRNGSVAEDMRSAAEEAMCNRLRPHFEKLAYEWVDVEAGAQALSEAE